MIPGIGTGYKKRDGMNPLLKHQIIGHRGASAYAPENTMASFNKALSLGCRFIEFDVMLSEDGVPFVFHDETLKRTTNGRGEFGLTDAKTLASLDAGSWFSRRFSYAKIPTLQTVLEWLLASNVHANLEIKPYPGATEQTTVTVLSYLNRYWPHDRPQPLISSFDESALTLCRSLSPELPIGLLLDKWTDDWLIKAQKLACYSVHCNARILTAARVEAIQSAGFLVFAYTVNRKRLARKLFKWGVNAVFSDYPDLLGTPV